jgi:hypothetical protein
MNLEKFLDTMLKKETSDVEFVNENGDEIIDQLKGNYDDYEVIDVYYMVVARIKIKDLKS